MAFVRSGRRRGGWSPAPESGRARWLRLATITLGGVAAGMLFANVAFELPAPWGRVMWAAGAVGLTAYVVWSACRISRTYGAIAKEIEAMIAHQHAVMARQAELQSLGEQIIEAYLADQLDQAAREQAAGAGEAEDGPTDR